MITQAMFARPTPNTTPYDSSRLRVRAETRAARVGPGLMLSPNVASANAAISHTCIIVPTWLYWSCLYLY